MNLNKFAIICAIYIIYVGLFYKNNKILICGLLWMCADYLIVYDNNIPNIISKSISDLLKINNTTIFAILYMYIPAYIMSIMLFFESYQLGLFDQRLIKLFCVVFIVNNVHFLQYDKKYGVYILFFTVLFIVMMRTINDIHYDDVYFTRDVINNKYFTKSKYLFIIPIINNIPITKNRKICEYIKIYIY